MFCIIPCLLASNIKLFMHVVQSPGYYAMQESSSFILSNVTRDVMGGDDDSHTLVVVRCRGNMTWATDAPSDWTVVVHEKCEDLPGKNLQAYSRTIETVQLKNALVTWTTLLIITTSYRQSLSSCKMMVFRHGPNGKENRRTHHS